MKFYLNIFSFDYAVFHSVLLYLLSTYTVTRQQGFGDCCECRVSVSTDLSVSSVGHRLFHLSLSHSMRFPECFVAADEARELQRTIEKEIQVYIGKRHSLMGGPQQQYRQQTAGRGTQQQTSSSRTRTDSVRSGKGRRKRKHF